MYRRGCLRDTLWLGVWVMLQAVHRSRRSLLAAPLPLLLLLPPPQRRAVGICLLLCRLLLLLRGSGGRRPLPCCLLALPLPGPQPRLKVISFQVSGLRRQRTVAAVHNVPAWAWERGRAVG